MASNPVSFSVSGLKELDAALGELTKATARNVLRRVLKKAAEPMLAAAKQFAPDNPNTTRRLANALEIQFQKSTKGNAEYSQVLKSGGSKREAGAALRAARKGAAISAELKIGLTRDGFYGMYQEFGTVRHAAKPFIRPAFDQHKSGAIDIIKRDMMDEIKKAAARAAKRAAGKAARLK